MRKSEIVLKNCYVLPGQIRSHRNFLHPSGAKITISGNLGDDAKPYQEKEVKKVVKEVQENEKKG